MSLQWIDPPSGWQYGFPKIYDNEKDGPLQEWLVKEGYPDGDVVYLRSWMVEEREYATQSTEIRPEPEG